MPNTESPNFIYHTDTYSNESDYKMCAKNLLSQGLHIFQKFNHCEPQRIIIYFDNTSSDCIYTSIESLGLEIIVRSLITPPAVHFIAMCSLDSPNLQRLVPSKISFIFGQERPPHEFSRASEKHIFYYVKNYNSNTRTKTLKILTQILCKYTRDHSLGRLPLITINLHNLFLYDEICDGNMSTVHSLQLHTLI